MNHIKITINKMAKSPLQTGLLGVFTFFMFAGIGFGITNTLAPQVAEALVQGPPCCDGGGPGIIIDGPDPIVDPGYPGFPGGGGGGGNPIPQPPICEFFTATPNSVAPGGAVTLSWDTTRTTSATIDNGIGSVPVDGTRVVNPTTDTTYTLTATGINGDSVICDTSVTVVVVDTNPVCTLTADDLTLSFGESTTLRWTISNATEATLQHLDAVSIIAPSNGSQNTQAVGTYTLRASDADGDSVTCEVTITREVVDTNPVCTLTADDLTLAVGEKTNLRWTIDNATQAFLRHLDAVHIITPEDGMWTEVPAGTYTLTASDADGDSVTCQVTITVDVPNAPQCVAFTASPSSIVVGGSATLTWDTENATSVSINNGIGAVAADGTITVTPTTATTYVLTVSGAGTSVECQTTVTVVTANAPQCVSFTANPTSINEGGTSTLTWDTENADTVSIDNGIGTVTADGSRDVSPSGDTTYTLTVTGNGQTVTCDVFIDVDGGGGSNPGPQCDLFTVSANSINEGQDVILTWETTRADSVEIDNGIGTVAEDGNITVTPNGDTTYTLTARAGTRVDTCDVFVDVDNGGGGGSRRSPRISIDVLPPAPEGTFAVVSLSQIPYTGLDLGPMGTVFYWTALILWSGALAYLVLFKVLPLIMRRGAVAMSTDTQEEEVARPQYRAEGGFASLKHEDNLSVDDIVRGLSNGTGASAAYVEDDVDEEYVAEEEVAPVAPVAQRGISSDAAMFLNAVMAGDKTAAFGMLRRAGRSGSPEGLVEDALVLLDEAYRARIDGTECNQDVARICAPADNALLEQVIDALATAVDTSYSKAQTGAKMALTRALAIVQKS